jgi:hypothetical protein
MPLNNLPQRPNRARWPVVSGPEACRRVALIWHNYHLHALCVQKTLISFAKMRFYDTNRNELHFRQSFTRVYFACHSALTGNVETCARLRGFLLRISMLSLGNPCQAPHSVISANYRALPAN